MRHCVRNCGCSDFEVNPSNSSDALGGALNRLAFVKRVCSARDGHNPVLHDNAQPRAEKDRADLEFSNEIFKYLRIRIHKTS